MTHSDSARAERFWSRGMLAATAAYVVSRFLLYACFSASTSDVFVYFGYAVEGVDYGNAPYREITRLEYPPTAYWIICLPRLVTYDPDDKLVYPFVTKAEEAVYSKHIQRYDIAFRGLMLLFDAASFGLLLAIVRRRRPD